MDSITPMHYQTITVRDVVNFENYLNVPVFTGRVELSPDWLLKPPEPEPVRRWPDLYIFWLEKTPLYIGATVDISRRLEQHMGLTDAWGNARYDFGVHAPNSEVGRFVSHFAPESLDWTIQLLCSRDFTLAKAADVKPRDAGTVEEFLIKTLKPCFNTALNPEPSAIPEPFCTLWQKHWSPLLEAAAVSVYVPYVRRRRALQEPGSKPEPDGAAIRCST